MLDRVTELIEENQITDYQITDKVIAKSLIGDPRLDTAVWPGYNVIITMQIADNAKVENIIHSFKELNKQNASGQDELITVCGWDMNTFFIE